MRIHSCSMALMATIVCVSAAAQLAADDAPGVVRMSDRKPAEIQQASFSLFSHSKSNGCADGCGEAAAAECAAQSGACEGCGEAAAAACAAQSGECDGCSDAAACATCPQNAAACCPAPVQCGSPAACCDTSSGCAPQSHGAYCGQQCAEGCNTHYGADGYNAAGGGCPCGCCCGGNGNCDDEPASLFGHLFGSRRCRRSVCTCDRCEYCGKGCGLTLFDKLCGGGRKGACGQGAPLFGKYQIHYANSPGYADARDGQAWAAQGYGMPVTIPTAPVVRYTYNYSHGTPASRLTPLSTYNPATSAQPLYFQSWH